LEVRIELYTEVDCEIFVHKSFLSSFTAGTWGFFENWHLKEDYKKASKRHELAAKLQRNITWFAIGNLFLGVFIFFWQLVYFFFNNAEVSKTNFFFLN
jgi:hypothetical protein